MKYLAEVLASALFAICLAAAGCTGAARAQAVPGPGSRNVAVADPAIPRPRTEPCVVQLFPNQSFGRKGNDARMDAVPHRFHYRPPSRCKEPWAKVVLEVNFAVDAGHQYDRTASIWLDGVNLYFGTTEEPSPGVARSWQVQRDLTDYSSLFRTPCEGQALINNWIGPVFSSTIHVGAKLLFYPADAAFPAPVVPDQIDALNAVNALPAKLGKDNDRLSRSMVFPRNTTRVYLDLFAQPQAHDEFYYMCLPDEVIEKVGSPPSNGSIDRSHTCGGGSFREVEVSIDGQPAGMAPVSPWVFTGGLDPFLWQPTPGGQTLNFMPYRVDLTPFAGLLSDGKPHTVSVRVVSAPHFFSIAGALLVYQDKRVAHTGGAVTRNTLATASLEPTVTSTLKKGATGVHGDVLTHASQHYVIEGYVDTSEGRVQSRVGTTIGFDNTQQFEGGDAHGRYHIVRQTAHVDGTSSTSGAGTHTRSLHQDIGYTLDVHTLLGAGPGKARRRDVQILQRFQKHILQREQGLPFYAASISNAHLGADRLGYRQGNRQSFTSHDQTSTQDFRFTNSLGDCYQAEVMARDGKVTRVTHGQGCLNPGALHWFVHPDGSPDSFGWRGVAQPHQRSAEHVK